VKIPATTANLGPGFDSLGMALDIYNTVTVEKSEKFKISISGEGEDVLSLTKDNLVYLSFAALYNRIGLSVPKVKISCQSNIPLTRGLGSSATAIVGGLVAANSLCGEPLSSYEILKLGTLLEGHPDNVVAALFGGCQVIVQDGEDLVFASIPFPPELKAVLFIPDFEMKTTEARKLLPQEVSRADAIYNIGRVALLTTVFATGKLEHLRVATQDRLHQPQRQALFPAMYKIFDAALEAGALGVFLSGGGPTILALAQNSEAEIGKAVSEVAKKFEVEGEVRMAHLSSEGAIN
jgi:homoserine kinase